MITTRSDSARYRTVFTNGRHEYYADTTPEKGGGDASFRPHDLLEAALACCMNMSVRISAEKNGIPITGVTTQVSLNRDDPAVSHFEFRVEFEGPITEAQREILDRAVAACPVHDTLSRRITFARAPSGK